MSLRHHAGMRWLIVMSWLASHEALAGTRCSCEEVLITPRPGATNIPLNARIVVLNQYDHDSFYVTGPGQPVRAASSLRADRSSTQLSDLSLPRLVPGSEYSVEGPDNTSFRTGWHVDLVAPPPPVIHSLTITNDDGDPASIRIDLRATLSDDTALLRWTINDAHGRSTSFMTVTDRWPMCDGIFAGTGDALVALTAIDFAGNESVPLTIPTTIRHHTDLSVCRSRYLERVAAAWNVVARNIAIGLILLRAIITGRRLRARAVDGAPISLLAIDHAARSVRLLSYVAITLGSVGLGILSGWPVVPAVLVTMIAFALERCIIANAVLRLVEAGGVARIDGASIVVRAAHRCVRFKLMRWQISRAQRRAVPNASVLEHVR
ncbi:MAG: hypothetical protein JWO36_7479 [Myxococcales bacterium]|nr:hypothetical protein [Myxococcales bacterium]